MVPTPWSRKTKILFTFLTKTSSTSSAWQNDSDQQQTVTIRIFLAPEIWIEDNTSWIEMDRFGYTLKGSERAVVYRPAKLSSVIRKPAIGHEDLEKSGGADELGLTNSLV